MLTRSCSRHHERGACLSRSRRRRPAPASARRSAERGARRSMEFRWASRTPVQFTNGFGARTTWPRTLASTTRAADRPAQLGRANLGFTGVPQRGCQPRTDDRLTKHFWAHPVGQAGGSRRLSHDLLTTRFNSNANFIFTGVLGRSRRGRGRRRSRRLPSLLGVPQQHRCRWAARRIAGIRRYVEDSGRRARSTFNRPHGWRRYVGSTSQMANRTSRRTSPPRRRGVGRCGVYGRFPTGR